MLFQHQTPNALNLSNSELKKYNKEHSGDFIPIRMDVRQFCENHGHPEYYTQIVNRINRDMEEESWLQEYTYVALLDSERLLLPEKGVLVYFDILTSYFGESSIFEMIQYLHEQNKLREQEYMIDTSIKAAKTEDLKRRLIEWEEYERIGKLTKEAKELFCGKVEAELKNRRRLIKR